MSLFSTVFIFIITRSSAKELLFHAFLDRFKTTMEEQFPEDPITCNLNFDEITSAGLNNMLHKVSHLNQRVFILYMMHI